MEKWVTLHRRASSENPCRASPTDPSTPGSEPNAGQGLPLLFDSGALPTVSEKLLLAMSKATPSSPDGEDEFEETKMGLDELLRGALPNLVPPAFGCASVLCRSRRSRRFSPAHRGSNGSLRLSVTMQATRWNGTPTWFCARMKSPAPRSGKPPRWAVPPGSANARTMTLMT